MIAVIDDTRLQEDVVVRNADGVSDLSSTEQLGANRTFYDFGAERDVFEHAVSCRGGTMRPDCVCTGSWMDDGGVVWRDLRR